MAEQNSITEDNFRLLLRWLDPDLDLAGHKYEVIRERLIRMFEGRGCHEPEFLTDQTLDRVTQKLPDIDIHFEGDPIGYFYKVAAFIHKEWIRNQRSKGLEVPITDLTAGVAGNDENIADEYRCLEQCLDELLSADRYMIVEYYRYSKTAKIKHRIYIAEKLKITLSNLHTRANRVRERLSKCVQKCIQR